jgi:NAD(P)-dependent dehydrogenase (short-subunit alcohol dehydrogenase family)
LALSADVTSAADLAAVYDRPKDAFGTLDIVCANAGVAFDTPAGRDRCGGAVPGRPGSSCMLGAEIVVDWGARGA